MAAPPFKVKAIYEYTSEHEDDLTFPVGQIITVTELEGDDWYVGEYTDVTGGKHDGLFPLNFVEKYEPEIPTRPSRPPRQKQDAQQAPAPAPAPPPAEEEEEPDDIEEAPPVPASSKPSAAPVDIPSAASKDEQARSLPPASTPRSPATRAEPLAAPKPAPVEPAETAAASAKKPPPPVAAKSNAFKDRIAAFNQPAAAPLAPMQPGRQPPPSGFIKKPFVAPPPSKNAYVPPPSKVEPVHKPYIRDEDPEIKQREEEDRAAAEAAGLANEPAATAEGAEDEDAPKPMTLKERMAMLQKQQQEQAQRRAEASSHKKEKKAPQKKPSESSDYGYAAEAETEDLERVRSDATERQSSDIPREKPRVPSAHRRPPELTSPVPAPPEHEILSDGHEADQSGAGDLSGDDTGTLGPDDSDERSVEALRHPVAPKQEADVGDEEDTTEGEEGEEEDEVDEETRRKEELRARMARLGGGMPGMGAPFNPFGAPPPAPPKKKQPSKDRKASASEDATSSQPQQRVAMVPVPVPGMQRVQSPESDTTEKVEGDEDEEEGVDEPVPQPPTRSSTIERGAPPPVPKDSRPVPPPPSQDRAVPAVPSSGVTPRAPESRPVPPPPPAAPTSPGPGSESDDEMSSHAKRFSTEISGVETSLPMRSGARPVPGSREVPPRPPQSPEVKRSSTFGSGEPQSATSDKRASRPPPPIPDSPVTSPRPPPPPPPTQVTPSRQSTMDPHDDERGSDYDGDYDTDIASSAKHKDALKAPHYRDSSLTDNSLADETSIMTPPPPAAAPRAVPPPPPQSAPKSRPSMDRPPPPIPQGRDAPLDDEEGYDPYRYPEASRAVPPVPNAVPAVAPPRPPVQEPEPMREESSADDLYAPASPPLRSNDRGPPPPPHDRSVPAPPQQAPPTTQAPSRSSTDAHRSATVARRSMEQGRPSGEHGGQIAGDLNLSPETPWWTAPQPLPPVLQSRNGVDLLSESEESSKSKRGGRKEVSKDIYVLFMDYSQTIISARFDSQEPADVALEQRHEAPPPKLRQDQLEAAWQRFGTKIADAAGSLGSSKKDSVVGDGSPHSLPFELIKAQRNALLPVGTRAYGALVYANLANASTMQFDEIRRGDIITVRNARFEGHHGAMKSKYKTDYGPNHVAIVEEWDGTRRSARAWEQGREKKGGVRSEKFRLGDLRSGEVRVWRVVGRDWVGWDS